MDAKTIEAVAGRLAAARRVAVSSGAGMSAESGVATFRDADGLWSKFNPAELATPQAFRRDPAKVWAWYRQRRAKLAAVEPHVGHRLLAEWEARVERLTIVTQNVDGLHHRAGSKHVIELHGRLDVVRCSVCSFARQTLDDLGPDPLCECGERLRPGVVWFSESLPSGAFEAAVEAVRGADVLLVIGTSGMVQPAASLAALAKQAGAFLVEINPGRTESGANFDAILPAPCGAALSALDAAWSRVRSAP